MGFTQNIYRVSENVGSATIELSSSSSLTTATFIIEDDDRNNDFANPLSLNEEANFDNGGDVFTFSEGTNIDATKELGEPNHAGNAGGASVWWSLIVPESSPVQVTTEFSDFDTLLGVYTGSSLADLTEVASNDDISSDLTTSEVFFNAVAGTTYYIAVDGYNDGSSVATGSIDLDVQPVKETFYQTDDLLISDQSTVTSGVFVSGLPGTVADVDVWLDITHSYGADLDVFLISPAGTRVEMFQDLGSDGDNFTFTTLDDEAATLIAFGSAPFTDSFRPSGLLSSFDNQVPNGIWSLEITDDTGGDFGTLNSWGLTIQAQL